MAHALCPAPLPRTPPRSENGAVCPQRFHAVVQAWLMHTLNYMHDAAFRQDLCLQNAFSGGFCRLIDGKMKAAAGHRAHRSCREAQQQLCTEEFCFHAECGPCRSSTPPLPEARRVCVSLAVWENRWMHPSPDWGTKPGAPWANPPSSAAAQGASWPLRHGVRVFRALSPSSLRAVCAGLSVAVKCETGITRAEADSARRARGFRPRRRSGGTICSPSL